MNHNHTPTLIQSPPHMHTHMHTHMHICVYTQEGYSPLHNASVEGHDRIVEMLLQAGATVDLQQKVEDCSSVVYCVHCTLPHNIQGKQETCPAHSQWLMQFSTMVDIATCNCSYQNNKSRYCHTEAYITQRDISYSDEHNLLSCYNIGIGTGGEGGGGGHWGHMSPPPPQVFINCYISRSLLYV